MRRLLSLVFPLGLVLCGAGVTAWMQARSSRLDAAAEAHAAEHSIDPDSVYYVFISELIVHPNGRDSDNETEDWDTFGGPDLFYEVEQHGKVIFQSAQRDNTFIANWRGITLPVALTDLQEIVKGDINIDIDTEEVIRAARVTGDSSIKLHVWDVDTSSPNDLVGTIEIDIADLAEGATILENPDPGHERGWQKLTVQLVKREGSVKDFLLPLLREITGGEGGK